MNSENGNTVKESEADRKMKAQKAKMEKQFEAVPYLIFVFVF